MMKTLFNDNWTFVKNMSHMPVATEVTGQPVDIPHDWQIYDANKLYEDGIGHYIKTFEHSKMPGMSHVFLQFDGVYMDSTVYLNDEKVFEWKYGYSSFSFEISDYLVEGENRLQLICRAIHPNSRWYSGAGIYRNVWMIQKPDAYIALNGIYISTQKENDGFRVYTDVDVCLPESEKSCDNYYVKCEISDGEKVTAACEAKVAAQNGDFKASLEIVADDVRCWDIDDPYMYKMMVSLYKNDVPADREEEAFGFRTIEFKPESGFHLNGRKLKLKGACMHHDLGALGAAFNMDAVKRQITILKEMGVNAIRTAHNMPAPEFIEAACDMGILIMCEAFDAWECSKTEYDYARFFKEWHAKDIESMVKRDRNAPCIIMWSIGNEIYDTHKDENGLRIAKDLLKHVRKYDYRHNAGVTICSNYMPWENAKKCADVVKLAGYNYAEGYYKEHHEEHPDWVIFGSETASIVQSRGIYHFPAECSILDDDDLQCSSLGNSTTSWGAKSISSVLTAERDAPFSAGTFIWSGFDYIGEPTPYHTKNSYFGQVDTAGFKKDSFYLYQSGWRDYRSFPMVHLLPYWDFNEGQIIDVFAYSNAPCVELFLNDVSLGKKEIDHAKGTELYAGWKVPYKSGVIEARAYDESGKVIATDIKRTPGDAQKIIMTADRDHIYGNGRDLVFVEIEAFDSENEPVANANNRIFVDVSGPGRLVGLDNGNSTDYESYKGKTKRLFSGKLLAIVAAEKNAGDIHITASSKGLAGAELTIKSLSWEKDLTGVSALERNSEIYDIKDENRLHEIPVRKIELKAPYNKLDEKHKKVTVTAGLYPENTTYRADELVWRVTTSSGVDTNIAKISPMGDGTLEAFIEAVGDGCFRVRCECFNGSKAAQVISELEFSIEGMGTVLRSAYEFTSSSLFSKSSNNFTNGNERGIASPIDEDSFVYYDNIDFGNYGSRIIKIPFFELDSRPFEFKIWKGVPYTDKAEVIALAVYDKPSIWNTYQEETFVLDKELRGVCGVGFSFSRKAHFKGFVFEKNET